MFTPAIRAILYPSSAPRGPMPHLDARKSRKRKTDARTDAPPETGGTGWMGNRIPPPWGQGYGSLGRKEAWARMNERRIHQLFEVSVALKGLHAVVEIAGGIALALFDTDAIVRWLYSASEGRPDWIEEMLTRFAGSFSGQEHHYYVSLLVSHGFINLALVV